MIIDEQVSFHSDGLRLEGILSYPDTGTPEETVLVCSPHPHFAGNMENNIVKALARTMAEEGHIVLRFDYRGIGSSEIVLPDGLSSFDYWEDVETNKKYGDILHDVAAAAHFLDSVAMSRGRRHIVGYSFGAIVGMMHGADDSSTASMIGVSPPFGKVPFHFLGTCKMPVYFLAGDKDFVATKHDANEVISSLNGRVHYEILEGHDHFFRGVEELIADKVATFVREIHPHSEGCRRKDE